MPLLCRHTHRKRLHPSPYWLKTAVFPYLMGKIDRTKGLNVKAKTAANLQKITYINALKGLFLLLTREAIHS